MLSPRPITPATRVAEFPPKLAPLFQPMRYKVAHGGRGGAKSWSFARALLLQGTQTELRILCCREIQKSMKESVYQLLVDQIKLLGLAGFYQVLESEIRGRNGTTFTFHGLRHNVDNIKSLEGADRVWIEEGQTVSANSLNKLTPTVRKAGSEIWVTFNPELVTDAVYDRFIAHKPDNAWVVQTTYRDNPWLTKELNDERLEMKARDPDSYQHVWEGATVQHLVGAVYGREIAAAESEGRILHIPYDPSKGVSVYADLGWGDMTSLWFAQRVGMERRILKAYQNRHKLWQHYLKFIQDQGYVIECIYLPHDAESGSLTGLSVAKQTRDNGLPCYVIPKMANAVRLGINAVRNLFPSVFFDAANCADGLAALRHYRYEVDPHGNYSDTPVHDETSHYADAFRYLATADQVKRSSPKPTQILKGIRPERPAYHDTQSGGWMRR